MQFSPLLPLSRLVRVTCKKERKKKKNMVKRKSRGYLAKESNGRRNCRARLNAPPTMMRSVLRLRGATASSGRDNDERERRTESRNRLLIISPNHCRAARRCENRAECVSRAWIFRGNVIIRAAVAQFAGTDSRGHNGTYDANVSRETRIYLLRHVRLFRKSSYVTCPAAATSHSRAR